jgi:hypothetical protein
MAQPLQKMICLFLIKLNIGFCNPTPWYLPYRNENLSSHKKRYMNVYKGSIKTIKYGKCSNDYDQICGQTVEPCNGILLSNEKE